MVLEQALVSGHVTRETATETEASCDFGRRRAMVMQDAQCLTSIVWTWSSAIHFMTSVRSPLDAAHDDFLASGKVFARLAIHPPPACFTTWSSMVKCSRTALLLA
ncbi:hypothetical protein PI124_g3688 [Phytophthora idaei]|nr:hypothetical protein PI124_g3688 [Phytophthora idaei]